MLGHATRSGPQLPATPSKSGESLTEIIRHANRWARPWFGYFCSIHVSIHSKLEQMLRRRLRSILSRRRGRERWGDAAKPTISGPMPSSTNMNSSHWNEPMLPISTPKREPDDRRAVCGKTARTVLREGRPALVVSTPIQGVQSRRNLTPLRLAGRSPARWSLMRVRQIDGKALLK